MSKYEENDSFNPEIVNMSSKRLQSAPVVEEAEEPMTNKEKMSVPVHVLIGEIPYRTVSASLVETIELDLGKMRPGDRIKVKDLSISKDKNIEVLIDAENIVLNIDGHR